MNEGESEVDVDEPMRLGGRPLNDKNNHSQDKINVAKAFVVQQGRKGNILGIIMTLMILISRKVYIGPSSDYATL